MISAVRKRVTYANVVMTLALVFAMTGGAYAAKHYLITSTKQISPKVLRALKGKRGPAGREGKQGPQGPQGPAGASGKDGLTGGKGANGTDGTSVTSAESKGKIGPCAEGGSEFKAASGITYACNGKPGSPWTAGGTLPSEQSEMGTWGAMAVSSFIVSPVSFTIPLKNALPGSSVHFVTVEDVSTNNVPAGCGGTAEAPEAEAGNLCVFEGGEGKSISGGLEIALPAAASSGSPVPGAGTAGATLLGAVESGVFFAHGTWVVKAS